MNLREYRFLNRLSQEDLAKEIGVSSASISRYENEKVKDGIIKKIIDNFLESVRMIETMEPELVDFGECLPAQSKFKPNIQEQELQEQYINLLLKKALNSIDLNEKKLIINKISNIVNL